MSRPILDQGCMLRLRVVSPVVNDWTACDHGIDDAAIVRSKSSVEHRVPDSLYCGHFRHMRVPFPTRKEDLQEHVTSGSPATCLHPPLQAVGHALHKPRARCAGQHWQYTHEVRNRQRAVWGHCSNALECFQHPSFKRSLEIPLLS